MTDQRDNPAQVDSLFRAVRFAIVAITLALAYINIRATMAIPSFKQIFADMLEGQTLPLATTMILQARHVLLLASWLIPVAAIWAIFMPLKPRSFYLIGLASLLIIIQSIVVCTHCPNRSFVSSTNSAMRVQTMRANRPASYLV